MSTNDLIETDDTTQTEAPVLPPLAPAPAERKPINRLLIALIAVAALAVIAVTTLTITTTQQHSKAVDARASLADTRADLKGVRTDLANSESSLASAESTISANDDALAACSLVVEISDHQYESIVLMLDEAKAYLNFDYTSDNLDRVGKHVDKVNAIVEDNGYGSYEELWDACTGDYTPL